MNSGRDVDVDVARADEKSTEITYPTKDPRYSRIWWNRTKQYCYTEDEIALIAQIDAAYLSIIGDDKGRANFKLTEETQWREWWTCTKPTAPTSTNLRTDSFTLPNREAKDSKAYPLWNFADNMARKIANWQSERVKGQQRDLMNDPVMLIFDELREWFFTDLAEKECKISVLDDIAKRQSYIKSLIHLTPNFGPDRSRLHEVQGILDKAAQILRANVANKELPQLLSDLIISGKSLETTLGTYLHFLLVDEEVADNFSPDSLEALQENCKSSPICRIYRESMKESTSTEISLPLSQHQSLNRFYEIQPIRKTSETIQAKLQIRESLLNTVRFAMFAKRADKITYLEALAAIEALMNIRKTLEKFNHIQTSLGTYAFAVNYLEQANSLATHYIQIIERSKQLITKLIKTADEGHSQLLSNKHLQGKSVYFERNLRALETRFAKGTTVSMQLDAFCQRTIGSMQRYQDEMKKLVASVQSGQASRELEVAMRDLYEQMNYLNSVLPALLGEPYITIKNPVQLESATSQAPTALSIFQNDEAQAQCPLEITSIAAEPEPALEAPPP